MGSWPTEQQIASVHDAYSTNQVCGPGCAGDLTKFIGRPSVQISTGSNGYLGGEVVNQTTHSEWRPITGGGSSALDVATEFYQQYIIDVTGIASEEGR